MDLIQRWDRSVGERYPDLTMLRKSIWRGTLSENDGKSDDFPPRSLLWKVLLLYGTFDKKSWNASQERDLKRYNLLVEQYEKEINVEGSTSSGGSGDNNGNNQKDTNTSNISNITSEGNETEISIFDSSSTSTSTNTSTNVTTLSSIITRVIDDPLSQDLPTKKDVDDIDISFSSSYQDDEDLNDIIIRDVDRAFPEVEFFRDESIKVILHRILYIYARQNKDIGYRQGMHELAGPMLWVMANDNGIDNKYIESDAYTIFQAIMKNAKVWYLPPKLIDSPPPIVLKSKKIQESILKLVDPQIYNILIDNEIEPQIWGIRWIRLMFGREFGFHQMLKLWDSLFAADGLTLELIDYICVTMLIRIRNIIIEEPHYAEILTTLLNYPTNPNEPPYLYIINALYLKSRVNPEGGRYVFEQFENYDKVEKKVEKKNHLTPPLSTQGSSSPSFSPLISIPSINLDSLRDAAKNVTKNVSNVSKRLDIDRRVRDAFDQRVSIKPGEKQIKIYEDRNEILGNLLASSLNILEGIGKESDKLQLSHAIATIHHVRECLLNASLPIQSLPLFLPEVQVEHEKDSIPLEDGPRMNALDPPSDNPLNLETKSTTTTSSTPQSKTPLRTPRPSKISEDPFTSPTRSNPLRTSLLANSDFSWMLDSPGPSPPDIRSKFKTGATSIEQPIRKKTADIFELS